MPQIGKALKLLRAFAGRDEIFVSDLKGVISLLEFNPADEHGYRAGVKDAVMQFESYGRPRFMRGEINSFDLVQDTIDAFITSSCFECTRCCQMVLGEPGYVAPPMPSSSDGLPDVVCQRCAEQEERAWEAHDRMFPPADAARHFEPDPRD